MCGGGSGSSTSQYQGPPGPGTGIGSVLIGQPDYRSAAKSLLSTGQTYGRMAALAAQNAPQQPAMEAPPAPQSAFNGGIGQYLAQQGSRSMGPSPAMAEIQGLERRYDPSGAAAEMLQGYQPVMEARPLSYYTPNAMANAEFQSTAAPAASSGGGGRDYRRPGVVSRSSGGGGYTSIGDMFDGGGPGSSGDKFGGALGGVSNRLGFEPRTRVGGGGGGR